MSNRRKEIMKIYSLWYPYFLVVGLLLVHKSTSAPTDSSPESIPSPESLVITTDQELSSHPALTPTPQTVSIAQVSPKWNLLLAFWQPTKDAPYDNDTDKPNIQVKSSSVAVKDPNGKVKTVEVRARVRLPDDTEGTHEQIIEALRPMESLLSMSMHSEGVYDRLLSPSNPIHDRRISEIIIPVSEAQSTPADDFRSRKVTREVGDIQPTKQIGVIELLNSTVVDPPTESTVVLNEQLSTSDPTKLILQNDQLHSSVQVNQSEISPTTDMRLRKNVTRSVLRADEVDMLSMFSTSERSISNLSTDDSVQIDNGALEINSQHQDISNNNSETLLLPLTNESKPLDLSNSNNESVSIVSSSFVVNESVLDNSSETEEVERPKESLRSIDINSQTQNDMAAEHMHTLRNKEIMKEVIEEVLESAKKKVSDVLHGLENVDAPVPQDEAPQVMDALNQAQHQTHHAKEVLTLEQDRSTIFAILQVAQDTNTLEDPFQVTSMMEAKRHENIGGGNPSNSSRVTPLGINLGSLINNNGETPTGTSLAIGDPRLSALYTSTDTITPGRTQKASESFEGQAIIPDHQHTPLTIITDDINNIRTYDIEKPDKSKGKKKKIELVDELDTSNVEEKKATSQNSVILDGEIFSISEMNEEFIVKNETEPIYEEIAATLKVDTSIIDVEDFDITIKSTENTDEYLPQGNHTRPNLIEPELVRDIQGTQSSFSVSLDNSQLSKSNPAISSPQSPQTITTDSVQPSLEIETNINQQIDGDSAYAYEIINVHEGNTSESNVEKNNSDHNDSQKEQNINDIQIDFEEAIIGEPKNPVIILNSETNTDEHKFSDQNLSTTTSEPSKVNEENDINAIKVIPVVDEYLTQNEINVFEAEKPSAHADQDTFDVTQSATVTTQAAINTTGHAENAPHIPAATSTIAPTTTTQTWYNETAFHEAMSTGHTDPYAIVLKERASLMLELMDPTADPCEDFYQFACGRWRNNFPLREDKAVDNTFERLKEDLDEVLRTLLEKESLPDESPSTTAAKRLYHGCMNTESIETLGAQPLLELLRDLGGWPVLDGDDWDESGFNWVEQMARLRTFNNDILIAEWVAADITNSSNHIILLDQADLGLPGREYYTNPGDHHYREAYLFLMLKVCRLLGADEFRSLEEMSDVLYFEKQLSRILTPSEERRNLSAVHRHMTIDELQEAIPKIDWHLYLTIVAGGNVNFTEEVVVFGLDYFRKLVSLLDDTNNRTLSNYLLWRFVKNRIANLDESFLEAKQHYIKVLFGRQSQPERWRSCVSYVSGNIGYVVGAMFVKRYFPQASKNDTEEMITLIRESFIEAVQEADWMSPRTRDVAIQKVETIVRNIGYPDQILNDTYMNAMYEGLNFTSTSHFSNVLQMLQYHAASAHDLLTVPVDRKAWVTTPAVVNAYYSRSKNMIVFPAGILQPPFYHPSFPRSLNFGGIGVVIGHEITHGFDDQGRQFDKSGNLQQWWSAEDVSQFYKRALCMLDQYGEYEVGDAGLKVNPINTLGENIADNAGVKIAFKAYKKWTSLHEEHKTLPHVHLSHDQLFFINFGQIWCEVNSPEAMLTKIRSGQHSPNKFRVIGTLSNSYEFSEAFQCPAGSNMNPPKKCKVW